MPSHSWFQQLGSLAKASYGRSFRPFFTTGQPASNGVRAVVEDDNTNVLRESLVDDGRVRHIEILEEIIHPGEDRIIKVDAAGASSRSPACW